MKKEELKSNFHSTRSESDPPYIKPEAPKYPYYPEWKKELIKVTAKETGRQEWEIKINDEAAYEWWCSGISPYYCFRENFSL